MPHSLLESRHQFSRALDINNKLQISLITESAITPSLPFDPVAANYSKRDFTNDLEYFAPSIIAQTVRSQAQLTIADVREAPAEAIPPILEEVHYSVNSAISSIVNTVVFPSFPDNHEGRVEASASKPNDFCTECERRNNRCFLWRIKHEGFSVSQNDDSAQISIKQYAIFLVTPRASPSSSFYTSIRATLLSLPDQLPSTSLSFLALSERSAPLRALPSLPSASCTSATSFYFPWPDLGFAESITSELLMPKEL